MTTDSRTDHTVVLKVVRTLTLSMMLFLLLVGTAMKSCAQTTDETCPRLAPGSVVPQPNALRSKNGRLELTLHFRTMVDAQGLTRFCYLTPTETEAPTLRVRPGDDLIIHFHNDLPATTGTVNMSGMKMLHSGASDCHGDMNQSATNIHFHGLNIPPTCHQDEVIHTLIQPSESFDYHLKIPRNEPPGLYWYHPHPHGFSESQVLGGASGALIVEGIEQANLQLRGLPERILILRDEVLPESAGESSAQPEPAKNVALNYVPVPYPAYQPAVIQTRPLEKQLWRVLNAAADTIFNLQVLVNHLPQKVQVVAIDGVPIGQDSGSSQNKFLTKTQLLLPPGSRIEFVVVTPDTGEDAQLVTKSWDTGPDGDADPARPLAQIVSSEKEQENGSDAINTLATPVVPAPGSRFSGLSQASPIRQRHLYFSEALQDPNNPNSPTSFYLTVQGQKEKLFDPDAPPNIATRQGAVEDWIVENRTGEDHIFHIHQLHFKVLERNSKKVNDPPLRDTVDLPYWKGSGPYPSVKLRMDFRDPEIAGTFVYHCHILEHEDGGMMGSIKVVPAKGQR